MENVSGTVLWYAKAVADNVGGYGTNLRNIFWRNPSLQPLMPFIDDKAPKRPRGVKPIWTSDGYVLFWKAPKGESWQDKAHRYVVYRFENGEPVNLENASKIVAVTQNTYYLLPYENGTQKYNYVVTALDRMSNESKGTKKKVKL